MFVCDRNLSIFLKNPLKGKQKKEKESDLPPKKKANEQKGKQTNMGAVQALHLIEVSDEALLSLPQWGASLQPLAQQAREQALWARRIAYSEERFVRLLDLPGWLEEAQPAAFPQLQFFQALFDWQQALSDSSTDLLATEDRRWLVPFHQEPRLLRVYERLLQGFDTGIELAELAEEIGMQYAAFSRFVGQASGQSLSKVLLALRIAFAQTCLLERPELTIAEVAQSAGFSNLSNFNRLFLRETGRTPSGFAAGKRKVIF
ncbi:AraC family transcriptional regulator [Nitritalea halalkaliphila LW7]|uniref:AraC family transcriptional regulator n=2 Tax=Nitritalea TaxID=1187887 RepID=I5C527_9BACT|nr:AraC family transcriptional regulator [Nitritalea halalkaliphila LW7]